MNPFDKKPETQSSPAPQSQAGYNPFAVCGTAADYAPQLPSGVEAQVRCKSYRFTEKDPSKNLGTAVWVDLEIVKCFKGSALEGKIYSHKLTGFDGSGVQAAARSLNALNGAILGSRMPTDVAREWLWKYLVEHEEELSKGTFAIKTKDHVTKITNDDGTKRVIIKGEYLNID